jgi:hypothetical protein
MDPLTVTEYGTGVGKSAKIRNLLPKYAPYSRTEEGVVYDYKLSKLVTPRDLATRIKKDISVKMNNTAVSNSINKASALMIAHASKETAKEIKTIREEAEKEEKTVADLTERANKAPTEYMRNFIVNNALKEATAKRDAKLKELEALESHKVTEKEHQDLNKLLLHVSTENIASEHMGDRSVLEAAGVDTSDKAHLDRMRKLVSIGKITAGEGGSDADKRIYQQRYSDINDIMDEIKVSITDPSSVLSEAGYSLHQAADYLNGVVSKMDNGQISANTPGIMKLFQDSLRTNTGETIQDALAILVKAEAERISTNEKTAELNNNAATDRINKNELKLSRFEGVLGQYESELTGLINEHGAEKDPGKKDKILKKIDSLRAKIARTKEKIDNIKAKIDKDTRLKGGTIRSSVRDNVAKSMDSVAGAISEKGSETNYAFGQDIGLHEEHIKKLEDTLTGYKKDINNRSTKESAKRELEKDKVKVENEILSAKTHLED